MGSVKDLQVIKEATPDSPGRGRFIFSDRYSVFDWGEMPDHIPHKGESIAILAAYFFEKLENKDVLGHYIGLVEGGKVKRLRDVSGPVNTMEVKLLPVLLPKTDGTKYDYSIYKNIKGAYLIPLEVIYRNFLLPTSSLFKRLQEGKVKPEDYGIFGEIKLNQHLNPPILDVSTKLEITDRYMTWDEAQEISGLTHGEVERLKDKVLVIDELITEEFGHLGLVNVDGKFEFGFDPHRQLLLIDVLGTLDECRFTYRDLPVSKEIARVHYRKTAWFKAVAEAKKADRQNWKKVCRIKPEPLPPKLKTLISYVYTVCTNEITGKKWFTDTPPLQQVLAELKSELE